MLSLISFQSNQTQPAKRNLTLKTFKPVSWKTNFIAVSFKTLNTKLGVIHCASREKMLKTIHNFLPVFISQKKKF